MTPVRTVRATRYLSALRQASSVPIVVEADDDGQYLVKLRGAAQGTQALIAELVAGTLGRALGLPVPEIVLLRFDPAISTAERDAELRDLLDASAGLNLALDYLPGAAAFDPRYHAPPPPPLAARIVLFDAYVMNVDRTARPNNLVVWHDQLYLIDHGAALAFQYNWPAALAQPDLPCPRLEQHALLPYAGPLHDAAPMLATCDTATLTAIASAIPDDWLAGANRATYVDVLARRAAAPQRFLAAAEAARRQVAG